MIILDSLDKILDHQSPFVLTIGNFDGVHLGHQKLLSQLTTNKKDKTLVVTFDPHPVEFFDAHKIFRRLFSVNYQNEYIDQLGIDYLLRLPFDRVVADMSYIGFLSQFKKHLNLKKIIIGHDLKIGKDRQGDGVTIALWCKENGVEFQIVEPHTVNGQVVSSTYIKSLVEQNKFMEVPAFLGRFYSVSGFVVHGDKRGRLIGFPTANLTCQGSLYVPHFGVYQTRTCWKGTTYDSITNVGKTPTFKTDDTIKIETHIFDFNHDIYGDKISVEFLKFIRPEMKFSGIEEIKKQIAMDIASLGRRLKI